MINAAAIYFGQKKKRYWNDFKASSLDKKESIWKLQWIFFRRNSPHPRTAGSSKSDFCFYSAPEEGMNWNFSRPSLLSLSLLIDERDINFPHDLSFGCCYATAFWSFIVRYSISRDTFSPLVRAMQKCQADYFLCVEHWHEHVQGPKGSLHFSRLPLNRWGTILIWETQPSIQFKPPWCICVRDLD